MKSIFDTDGKYTPEANELHNNLCNAIKQEVISFVRKGYSVREIAHIATHAAFDVEIDVMLTPPEER